MNRVEAPGERLLFTSSVLFEIGVKPMGGAYACFIIPGTKLCYPEVACMLRCGSCSSKDKKLSLKTRNLRIQNSDKSDIFPSKS